MTRKSGVENLLTHSEDVLVTVTVDVEVFKWLHEMVSTKHRLQQYATWIPWYQQMVDRANESFEAAAKEAGLVEESPPPPPPAKAKKVAKANGQKAPEKPAKRVIRRRLAKK